MNRELKFRAWDKKDKKWLFGYDYQDLGGFSLIGEVTLMGELNSVPLHRWQDVAIMQFTGLLDKNGKEIYEGDIVKVLDRDWPSQLGSNPELNHQQYLDSISSICEVIWDKGSFWLEQRKGLGYYSPKVAYGERRDVCEVIGNIYENPELIEKAS